MSTGDKPELKTCFRNRPFFFCTSPSERLSS